MCCVGDDGWVGDVCVGCRLARFVTLDREVLRIRSKVTILPFVPFA